ncbi:MAG: pilin [Desulfobacterales bacterium]|nr:MAG: pilin [Desulfobacterales bacterium]
MSQPRPHHRAFPSKKNRKGFTVLELLVVTVIIGILATIAIMVLLSFKEKAGVATLTSDLGSAYKASVQYHMEHPNGTATLDTLWSYGFRASKNVNLTVVDGSVESLNMTATHPNVAGVYQVDEEGHVSKQ